MKGGVRMSHPENPLSTTPKRPTDVVEYDPKEHRRLKKRKNFWAIITFISLAAWLAAMGTSFANPLQVAPYLIAVLIIPLIALSVMAGEARHEFHEVDKKYKLVDEAFRVARGFLNPDIKLSEHAVFKAVAELEPPSNEFSRVYLQLLPMDTKSGIEDTQRDALVYRVSFTKLETFQGPKFSDILSDVRQVLIRDEQFAEANERMKSHFPRHWSPRDFLPQQYTGMHTD
jgi:hypothetical protein